MIYQEQLDFARKMAKSAGDIMKKYYRHDQHIEFKDNDTPLTVADTEINSMLIENVQQHWPEYGVLGEEQSWHEDRRLLWVCDPVDGTSAYTLHIPTSMFSVALVEDGEPVVAVCYNPWTDELYQAVKGQGSSRNGESIKVSTRKWGERTQLAGTSGNSHTEPANLFAKELERQGVHTTGFIGNVFKACLIAEGSIDGRTFMYNGAHDMAAACLLIHEAGGKVTDLAGKSQRYDRSINGAIMSNGFIHDHLVELVKRAGR